VTAAERDGRLVGLAIAVLGALLLLPALTMGLGAMGGGGMWAGGMQGPTGAPGWVWLVGLLLQAGVLVAVVALGYSLLQAPAGDGGTDPAVAELREAYARGDLTDEEYERRLDRLRETRNRY